MVKQKTTGFPQTLFYTHKIYDNGENVFKIHSTYLITIRFECEDTTTRFHL